MVAQDGFRSNGSAKAFPEVMVGGVPIQVAEPTAAAEAVVAWAVASRREKLNLPIRLSNAYCLALASGDAAYRDVMLNHGITFPDGFPVAWTARRLGHPEAHQVRGPGLFEDVINLGRSDELRHYFYGTNDDTLIKLRGMLEARYPGMITAGAFAPPFAPIDELMAEKNISRIQDTNPDVVWVGLGTPKQDFVAVRLAERLGVPVLGVGAAFDFSAGTLDEAPAALRRAGLEWTYRLAKEPGRLWRRYLFGNAQFIKLAVDDLVRSRRDTSGS